MRGGEWATPTSPLFPGRGTRTALPASSHPGSTPRRGPRPVPNPIEKRAAVSPNPRLRRVLNWRFSRDVPHERDVTRREPITSPTTPLVFDVLMFQRSEESDPSMLLNPGPHLHTRPTPHATEGLGIRPQESARKGKDGGWGSSGEAKVQTLPSPPATTPPLVAKLKGTIHKTHRSLGRERTGTQPRHLSRSPTCRSHFRSRAHNIPFHPHRPSITNLWKDYKLPLKPFPL